MGNCCVGCCVHAPETASPPIPEGVTRLCVAGGGTSPHVARARMIIAEITKKHGDKYESWFYFTSPGVCCGADGYYPYIQEKTANVKFPEHLVGHSTMPLVWLENGPNKEWTVLGGRQELADWACKTFPEDKEIVATAKGFAVSELCHGGCCCKYSDEEKDPHMFSTCLKENKAHYKAKDDKAEKLLQN